MHNCSRVDSQGGVPFYIREDSLIINNVPGFFVFSLMR